MSKTSYSLFIFAMLAIVASSNYLVQFPINDWLTWAAFIYPITFLITELANRFYGPQIARQIVYAGFITAAFLSIWLSTPRIAIASASAYLGSQLLDIYVFNQIRQGPWWYAPVTASFLASVVDTVIFWCLAFWYEEVPLLSWMLGDLGVKFGLDLLLLTPFRLLTRSSTYRGQNSAPESV